MVIYFSLPNRVVLLKSLRVGWIKSGAGKLTKEGSGFFWCEPLWRVEKLTGNLPSALTSPLPSRPSARNFVDQIRLLFSGAWLMFDECISEKSTSPLV